MDESTDWIVCGRIIGKATGWDEADTFVFHLYGFTPHPNYRGPTSDMITINYISGIIESYNNDGSQVETIDDLIDSIQHCPRV